jgi:hypothetical protein
LKSTSDVIRINVPKNRCDFEVERRCGNSDKLSNAVGYRPDTDFVTGFRYTYGHLMEIT